MRRVDDLLEREDELQQIERLIEDAVEGEGRLVLIEGPPGIGKTQLLAALRTYAQERGFATLSARASELDRAFPFGVVRQLFEPLIAHAGGDRQVRLLAGAAGPAAALLAASSPEQLAGDGDPPVAHFHALYWLTANVAAEAPLTLIIDDVHWADVISLRFLQFLVPRLEGLPVLVALATRPAEPGLDRGSVDALATDALALVVHPAPLSDRAVADIVSAELGDAADARFSDACHKATGGNPFLLRELLRELAAERVAPTADSVPIVRQLAPPTVARAVLLRLARLGDDASALSRAVAVLGDGVPLPRASALAELPDARAREVATALAQAGILATARPLAFAHPILRSVVYADIDPGERAAAHRRAATLLADEGAGADAVAVQLLATEPSADPDVVATLREAAARARERGAPEVATACLRRALDEPPASAERGPLILELAAAELHAGDAAAAVDDFAEGAGSSGDVCLRARFATEHAVALQAVGRSDDAYVVRERAAQEVSARDPELALLLESGLIASASLDLSRLGWARERLERHRGRESPETSPEWRLLATQTYLDAFYGDPPAEALADAAEAALASNRLIDARGVIGTSFFFAVEVLWLADRVEPARRALDHAVEAARRRGLAFVFACASGWRCMLLARAGELIEAEADARSCAALSLAQGWFVPAPPMLGYVLHVLVTRGELDYAEQVLESSGIGGRAADHDLTLYPMIHARASLRAARGDAAAARDDLASLARRRARWNTDLSLVPAILAVPEPAAPNAEEARASAERLLRDAETWDTPRASGMALRALGLGESGARGIELLEEAVAVLERSPARIEYARALTDFGTALRRTNRRSDARDPLRRALDVADSCGARPLADRARHELRAAGARVRRTRVSGVDALTASERRIAAMAADGMSNSEIAQALFVTNKTVEAHLGNAYRKLDIRRRTQLASALRAQQG